MRAELEVLKQAIEPCMELVDVSKETSDYRYDYDQDMIIARNTKTLVDSPFNIHIKRQTVTFTVPSF